MIAILLVVIILAILFPGLFRTLIQIALLLGLAFAIEVFRHST